MLFRTLKTFMVMLIPAIATGQGVNLRPLVVGPMTYLNDSEKPISIDQLDLTQFKSRVSTDYSQYLQKVWVNFRINNPNDKERT